MNKQITPPDLQTEQSGHLYWIDLIRFLAAFAVLACHFRGAFFVEYGLLPPEQQTHLMFAFYAVTRLGHEAVLVFFVLSGFLVGGKAMERIHDNSFAPRSYTIDRAVRIMLPLISSLILALVVNSITSKEIHLWQLIGNLFSLQGIVCLPYFETLWSLSYEVWFYILMCSLGYCVINANGPKAYLGLSVLAICFLVFTKLSAVYLFIWLTGAIGYLLLGRKSLRILIISSFATILLLCVLQLMTDSRVELITVYHDLDIQPYIEIVFSIVFVIYLSQAIQFPPRHKATISLNNIGTKLAAFSYTLYLTHIPIRSLLSYFGAPKCTSVNVATVSLYICWLLIAIAVAYCMYYFFERNTNKVKQWIKKKC